MRIHLVYSTRNPLGVFYSLKGLGCWKKEGNHVIYIYIVRRTRHAGHCWRSRDELIRDVLLWTPTHGRAKAGRPARTYIQQLCEDTGCCPEDLPRAMNDREEWRERVRDIRATSAIWWWYIYIYIYIYIMSWSILKNYVKQKHRPSKSISCKLEWELLWPSW